MQNFILSELGKGSTKVKSEKENLLIDWLFIYLLEFSFVCLSPEKFYPISFTC